MSLQHFDNKKKEVINSMNVQKEGDGESNQNMRQNVTVTTNENHEK